VQSSSQIITTNKPTSCFFTGQMPFLSPNQQCQSTEGNIFGTLVYNIVVVFIGWYKSYHGMLFLRVFTSIMLMLMPDE